MELEKINLRIAQRQRHINQPGTTPNGRKASVMLEEIGARYTVKTINIGKSEQFDPEFLRISPNNKIPAIVDDDGHHTVFETGAILIYLAEKAGRLLPTSGPRRDEALEWLFWASTGLAPLLGQWNYFARHGRIQSHRCLAIRWLAVRGNHVI